MNRIAILTSVLALTASTLSAADAPAPVGTRVADFTLPDVGGEPWSLAEQTREAKATVVLFLGTGCPVSNAYAPRLAEMHKRFAKEGVVFVGVYSHASDDAASVAKHAKEHSIPFTLLKDDGMTLAEKLSVERVPTAFVLDSGRNVRYKGRIDDQFSPGIQRVSASSRELFAAVNAVVEGREVKVAYAPPAGCLLTRERKVTVAAEPITYHKQVSRILQAKCQDCHRPGEAAPFSLLSYKQAKGWSDMIREVVTEGVMPPWHADAPYGHFRNDRRLSTEQKQTLLAWIDQGCPEGDAKDAPPERKFVQGWRLGREPDVVLKMNKTIDVPAQYLFGVGGGMPYQYVPVGEPFKEETWVSAVEVRPDFRATIHHIIAFIIPPGQKMEDIANEQFARHMLAAFVPGDEPVIFPPGFAKRLPKGSRLLFEVHYTPNGRPGKDRSMIGLVTSKTPPKYEMKGDCAFEPRFEIPPGASNHEVKSAMTFDNPVMLVALTPHMHLRGKAFRYELLDGETHKKETLLNVPRYDFNWQVPYALAKPRKVPAGSVLICTGWFDNSKDNPFNPDPSKKVRWGEQTWEEMMIGFVEYFEERKQ